jgi:hypothetical protein
MQGDGLYSFILGGSYDGHWVAGKFDGMGTYSTTDGGSYKGMWHAGLPHGHGRLIDAKTHHRFEGEFVHGRRTGQFNEYDEEGAFVKQTTFNDSSLVFRGYPLMGDESDEDSDEDESDGEGEGEGEYIDDGSNADVPDEGEGEE